MIFGLEFRVCEIEVNVKVGEKNVCSCKGIKIKIIVFPVVIY